MSSEYAVNPGLYIHIPFCLSKCSYCDFYSIPLCSKDLKTIPDKYIDLLLIELKSRIKQFNVKKFSTLYFGGGTPSLLSANQIEKLMTFIKPFLENNGEVTFECNPDDISKNLLNTLKKNGINRISLGIQSLNDNVLSYVNRRANMDINLNAIKLIEDFKRSLNKDETFRFSIDMIAGLPKLNREDFFKDLIQICNTSADHISLYSLSIEDGTPLAEDLSFYDDDENALQWTEGVKILKSFGYYQYEVSNFAKKGYESKHNLIYWHKNNYIGIGSGATGTFENYRYTNGMLDNQCDYTYSEEIEILNEDVLELEFLMMGFRLLEGVNELEYKKRFGKNLNTRLAPLWEKWKNEGLAENNGNYYTLGEKGICFLNKFLETL